MTVLTAPNARASLAMPSAVGGSRSAEGGIGPTIDVYDFFSGCGGTSRGFADAGLHPRLAVDWDADAIATYRANFPGAEAYRADVRTLHTSAVEHLFPRERRRPALVCACSPCQPYSRRNRHKKIDDERFTLLDEIMRFLRRFRPELAFFENVPESLNAGTPHEGGGLHPMLGALDDLGYHTDARVVDASEYGVPQARRRVVVIASLFGPIHVPDPTHGPDRLPPTTVRDAIASLPPLEAGTCHSDINAHASARLSAANLERVKASVEGGSWRSWPEHLRLPCHRSVSGHTDAYGRLAWDRPAPSLTTRCVSYSNGRFGHPEQDRALSGREAACLQTFEEDFRFEGTLTSIARQVGNAVPVKLARAMGDAFRDHARDHCCACRDGGLHA